MRLYTFGPPDKRRPVVVLTRNSGLGMLAMATVAPVTSSIRGVRSEVELNEEDGMKSPCAVNLHGVVSVRQALLGPRVAQLNAVRMRQVCAALAFALGCEAD